MSISSTNNNGPSKTGIILTAGTGAGIGYTVKAVKLLKGDQNYLKGVINAATQKTYLMKDQIDFTKQQLKASSELKGVFANNSKLTLREKISVIRDSAKKFAKIAEYPLAKTKAVLKPYQMSFLKHIGIGAAAATGVYIATKAIIAKKPNEIEE